jgi:hypothetical protein
LICFYAVACERLYFYVVSLEETTTRICFTSYHKGASNNECFFKVVLQEAMTMTIFLCCIVREAMTFLLLMLQEVTTTAFFCCIVRKQATQ